MNIVWYAIKKYSVNTFQYYFNMNKTLEDNNYYIKI